MMRFFSSAVIVSVLLACVGARSISGGRAPQQPTNERPTFYRDVLPILQQHCQACHRDGGIAPIPFETYERVARKAGAIADAVTSGKMPPWFADRNIGKFANDPSLTDQEISTLADWADADAPAGDPLDAPPPRAWAGGWNIPEPDDVVKMPAPVSIPAQGEIEYTYEIIPTGFKADKWVQMSQVRPSSPQYVHHAVVYIRPPDSK